jgi:hypothetical protein
VTRAVIDTTALLKMLYSSLLASIFVAIVFSTALLGAVRASDMRRAGRGGLAAAYAVLATIRLRTRSDHAQVLALVGDRSVLGEPGHARLLVLERRVGLGQQEQVGV